MGKVNIALTRRDVSPSIGQEDTEYGLSHPHRGYAHIFNHKVFQHMPIRKDTEIDVAAAEGTFTSLGFEVKHYSDLKQKEFLGTLNKIAKDGRGHRYCLVVVIMTYQSKEGLHCYDTTYQLKQVWQPFTADNCPSLAGKPKLFFVQACKYETIDDSEGRATQRDITPVSYTLPACADILTAESIVEENVAWKCCNAGWSFIQVLCKELETHSHRHDLLTILTWVCYRFATDAFPFLLFEERQHLKENIPAFTSMLTRHVFFR